MILITSEIRTTAQKLLDAYDRGALIPPPSEQHAQFDWKSAYEVAAAMVEMRRARGEKPVGRKIGFTNRNIWAEYGATSPIWAHVYDSTLVLSLIHISEPTRLLSISYAVFCLK